LWTQVRDEVLAADALFPPKESKPSLGDRQQRLLQWLQRVAKCCPDHPALLAFVAPAATAERDAAAAKVRITRDDTPHPPRRPA
jgi:hypothetical protein